MLSVAMLMGLIGLFIAGAETGLAQSQPQDVISEREMNLVANVASESTEKDPGVEIGQSTFFSGLKGFVGSGFEMFLRLNAQRMTRIALGSNTAAREWLRAFLKQCEDIPEKLALESALHSRLPQSRKQR